MTFNQFSYLLNVQKALCISVILWTISNCSILFTMALATLSDISLYNRSSCFYVLAGPWPGFKVWGELHFYGGKIIIFLICLNKCFWAQKIWGAQKIRGRCPRMPPRGYGPVF